MKVPSDINQIADLWLDGAAASPTDLRAARNLAERLAGFEDLRPFSTVVQRLIEEISHPDSDLADVCKILEADPGLASRVLKVANSAAYRVHAPCASLVQAVVRIGGANLTGLAMAMSALALFKDVGGMGEQVRQHSAGTAAIARLLAESLDRSAVSSQVFLVALLHDIGKLLLIQKGDPAYVKLVARERSPASLHLKEQAMWGFDHAMLGAHVLSAWDIPAPIPQLVAWHHQPKGGHCSATGLAPVMDLLRLADVIEWLLAQNCPADSPWVARLADSPDGIRAGLAAETLPSLWNDLRDARAEALQIFA